MLSDASGITHNPPFLDGNKRTTFMTAYTFLGVNGWTVAAPEPEVVRMVVGLSDRSISEDQFTAWLRRSCIHRKSWTPSRTRKRR